jgi:hypothetical protein
MRSKQLLLMSLLSSSADCNATVLLSSNVTVCNVDTISCAFAVGL